MLKYQKKIELLKKRMQAFSPESFYHLQGAMETNLRSMFSPRCCEHLMGTLLGFRHFPPRRDYFSGLRGANHERWRTSATRYKEAELTATSIWDRKSSTQAPAIVRYSAECRLFIERSSFRCDIRPLSGALTDHLADFSGSWMTSTHFGI